MTSANQGSGRQHWRSSWSSPSPRPRPGAPPVAPLPPRRGRGRSRGCRRTSRSPGTGPVPPGEVVPRRGPRRRHHAPDLHRPDPRRRGADAPPHRRSLPPNSAHLAFSAPVRRMEEAPDRLVFGPAPLTHETLCFETRTRSAELTFGPRHPRTTLRDPFLADGARTPHLAGRGPRRRRRGRVALARRPVARPRPGLPRPSALRCPPLALPHPQGPLGPGGGR